MRDRNIIPVTNSIMGSVLSEQDSTGSMDSITSEIRFSHCTILHVMGFVIIICNIA